MLEKRLVVVSNRLPVVIEKSRGGQRLQRGSGGLVTALTPVMEKNHGLWIGWAGHGDGDFDVSLFDEFALHHGYELQPVSLTSDQLDKYYHGFSNEALWPLFHDLLGHCRFEQENWKAYIQVNHLFAEAIRDTVHPDDFLWVQDYHLMLVAQHLRQMDVKQPLSFFLHIPFPSADLFRRLPWAQDLIEALIEYDLLGFQTLRDRRNFIDCVKTMIHGTHVITKSRLSHIHYGDRHIKVGHFPISIDFDEFNDAAGTDEVSDLARQFHRDISAEKLMLGIDRLDYTKGIPERFLAFEHALEKYPELRGNLSLFQLVIPSRTYVPGYGDLKGWLDQLVGRINGRFTRKGWIPIHYVYRSFERKQLLGAYRACDIALLTPLRDGMNLVAKEYCASQVDRDGVLILSEFAGAAEQLNKGAIIVNPYDRDGTADAIHEAFNMDPKERIRRMKVLRTEIKRNDVHHWVRLCFESFEDHKRQDFIVSAT